MAHIKDVKIGSDTYLIEPTVYAATAGNASAITAAVTNFALDTGVIVSLKITTANAASATLNVNGTGAKAVRYNNANIVAGALKANRFYSLLYDGSYWQLLGELDTNTTYSAGTGIGIAGTTISNSGVTGVKGSAESTYRTGQVSLSAEDVGAAAYSHTHAYVPYTSGANDLNTIYDTGFYNITSGSMTNGPTSYGYGNLIVLDYRKHSGNAKPDFAGQIYLHQGSGATNGNTLYYRSSTANAWSTWQMVAHTDSAGAKGSANTPVYVTSTGVITEGTTYAGGTAVTLNNASKAGATASFYAPTTGGTANTQALVGNGATTAPKWVNISPSITVGAGTATATPTINVTVLGQSGTAASITTASTSVYGATKLQDGVASTSTTLAATANAAYTASRSSLHTLGTTTKYYVTGVSGASTNTASDYFDTGIYSTTVAGELSAVRHSFNVSGTEKAYMYYNSTDDSIDFVFV